MALQPKIHRASTFKEVRRFQASSWMKLKKKAPIQVDQAAVVATIASVLQNIKSEIRNLV